MEAKFKSLSIFEFQKRFSCDEDCYKYLSEIKWQEGFKCTKCENTKWCKGTKAYTQQCTKCNYNESPSAGSLFHKVKFPLFKAF